MRTFVVLGAGWEGVVVKILEFRLNAGFGGLDILPYIVKVSLYCCFGAWGIFLQRFGGESWEGWQVSFLECL